MTQNELLRQQLGTFLRVRWVATGIFTAVSLLSALVGGMPWRELIPALGMLGIVIGSGLFLQWGVNRRFQQRPRVLAVLKWVVLMLDLFILAVLVHLTGGIVGLYVLTPLLYIVATAPVLGYRAAHLGAVWTMLLYGVMLVLEVRGILPYGQPLGPGRAPWVDIYADRSMIAAIFVLIVGLLFLGAQISGTVAGWLGKQRREIARLYRAADGEARRMQLINELSRSLSAILEWPTLLSRVFVELETVVGFDYAALYLYDEGADRLNLVATQGFSDKEAKEAEATAMERHPIWVIRNQETLYATDTGQDPRVCYPGDRRGGSILLVPLLYKDGCLGALELGSKEKAAFSTRDRELLEGLAGQLAIAVANARLYGESRQALEELHEAQEQVVRSNRLAAVGEVVAGLAHELNNPLGIILGNVQLSLETPGLDLEVRQSQEAILEASERIARLVRVLGDLELLQEERFQAVDVSGLLEEALALVGRQAAEEGVVVEKEIAPFLPRVWGSRARLLQSLYDLLLNAVEAMHGQDQPKRLIVTAYSGEGEVVLSLRDTGPGIPAGQLTHVFEPGFTTKVEEGRSRALGLGLFVAYYTARAHGGDLVVVSQEGSGTEVTARLPAMGQG